jgi:hypothetical protein
MEWIFQVSVSLQYNIIEHMINESDIEIHVNPTRIDEAKMRFIPQTYASNGEATDLLLSKS